MASKRFFVSAFCLMFLFSFLLVNIPAAHADGDTTVFSENTVLGQRGTELSAGIYEYNNLTLLDGVHVTSSGISQLVIIVKGTLTIGQGADIRVRNGYYENAPQQAIGNIDASNLKTVGQNMGVYNLYPNTFGKGGNGGNGGDGVRGTWPGSGGGGGGGGYGGGVGGTGGASGHTSDSHGSAWAGDSGRNNGGYGGNSGCGGYGANGGYADDIGENASTPTYVNNGGGGGGGNGGDGGSTGYTGGYGLLWGGSGGGGGGYGGGILTIVADKIVINSAKPCFIASGQIGGYSGNHGQTAQNGQSGQGGMIDIHTNGYAFNLAHWTATDIHSDTAPNYGGGHGLVTGLPQKVFINGVQIITGTETVPPIGITAPVDGVILSKTDLSLSIGGKYTLVATVTPDNADNKNVIWTSGDNSVAVVNNGTVIGISAGTTSVFAITQESSFIATCKVTVFSGTVQYTVTFNTQGGTAVASKKANANTTITAPSAPSRTGFTFGGWYMQAACTTPWNFATDKVTDDITLYAKWSTLPIPQGLYWSITSGKATITGYDGPGGNINLPGTIQGCPVTAIDSNAFAYTDNITKISIPASVTSIGDNAFLCSSKLTDITVDEANAIYSSLSGVLFNKTKTILIQCPPGNPRTSYTVPGSVMSIRKAFYSCDKLVTISIGKSVNSIKDGAFYECLNMVSINVDAANAYITSQDGVLFNKGKTELIQYPCGSTRKYYSIPAGVKTIDLFAFYENLSLESVTIPSSVTQIGEAAFNSNYCLSKAFFRGNAPSMDDEVFDNCMIGFKVYFMSGKTGFTNPWHGYPTATFQEYNAAVTPNNAAYGTVTGGGTYPGGVTVALTATPKAGYRFVRWIEGSTVLSINYSYGFTITKNRTITAEFAAIGKPAVSVVSVGYNQLKLSWAAIPGANSYEIYRSTTAATAYTKIATVTTAAYTDGGLTTGKNYFYKVRARCAAGTVVTYGAFSDFKAAMPLPSIPASVKAARASATSIKVTWGAVTGATKYEVWSLNSATGKYALCGTVSATGFTNTGLTAGKTYYYKVRAYRMVGTTIVYGGFSGVVSAKP